MSARKLSDAPARRQPRSHTPHVHQYIARDGTSLPYRVSGSGELLLVVPGGPGRSADYLSDLGGLASASGRSLVTFEPRRTGNCPTADDPAAYEHQSLVDDLESLRAHLGQAGVDLLAHSAGAEVALSYAARYPSRVKRLVLVTPSARTLGLEPTAQEWESQIARRRSEPWFPSAAAALEEIDQAGFTVERRQAMSPFLYGAWTATSRAHAATDKAQRNLEASRRFWAGAQATEETRRSLSSLQAPVRVLVGELDLAPGPLHAADIAAFFQAGATIVQPYAAHFPWIDDPESFARLTAGALVN